jgi:N4-gp56 family major capsid protein
MARTIVGLNDPKAVHHYSAMLAVDTARTGYWSRKFMARGEDGMAPITMLSKLENDAGENISYDLSVQLAMEPVEGDDVLEGQEEDLKFYSDNVYIDQMRGGVNTGGRMTRKRTIHNLRKIARKRQAEWWSRVFDELFFMYGSGARGINPDYIFRLGYTGRANNAFEAPDAQHQMYAGAATSKASLVSTDKVELATIDKVKVRAEVMGGGIQQTPQIQPILIDGEEHYVFLMHTWSEFDVRTATGEGKWLDIQKAATGAEGRKNPIFKGSLGMYNNVVLHSHKAVVRFDDYGAGGDVGAARNLFLGRQGLVCAFGSPGTGLRFDWHEESRDNGNQAVITTSTIVGTKKCRFNNKDFGLISVDSAAADPT